MRLSLLVVRMGSLFLLGTSAIAVTDKPEAETAVTAKPAVKSAEKGVEKVIAGSVTAVNPEKKEIAVERNKKKYTVLIDGSTNIVAGKEHIALDKIRKGDHVSINYLRYSDGSRIALNIENTSINTFSNRKSAAKEEVKSESQKEIKTAAKPEVKIEVKKDTVAKATVKAEHKKDTTAAKATVKAEIKKDTVVSIKTTEKSEVKKENSVTTKTTVRAEVKKDTASTSKATVKSEVKKDTTVTSQSAVKCEVKKDTAKTVVKEKTGTSTQPVKSSN